MNELERLKLALESAQCLVYEWRIDSDSLEWSGDFARVLSEIAHEACARHAGWVESIHPFDKEHYFAEQQRCINQSEPYHLDYRLSANGKTIWISDYGVKVERDGVTYLVGMIERKQLSSRSSASPAREESGGYQPFRMALTEAFGEAETSGRGRVVVCLSIDNLSTVMSWYDYEVVDRVMDDLEERLGFLLNNDEVIRRYAVDQFVMVLGEREQEMWQQLIESLHRKVRNYSSPYFLENLMLKSSSGSVKIPSEAATIEDTINKMFMSLETSKSDNGTEHFDFTSAKQHHQRTKEHTEQIYNLQKAMQEERLKLAFQPVIDARNGSVDSYECLLRILEPDGKIRSAGSIIPIAEKMGLIDTIDQYVLETIIKELKQSKGVRLAFNVSNMTTDSAKWLKMCTDLLQDPDLASRIVVEITETAAERNLSKTAYFVASLQALGCKVALDDFGAGHTSFRQLKALSVDMIKIDGGYVKDLPINSENQLFIRTLMDFTQSYGLKTIAECVESGEVAKMLMDMQVHYMQGYYFGKPALERPWMA